MAQTLWLLIGLVGGLAVGAEPDRPAGSASPADAAWRNLEASSRLPEWPREWAQQRPSLAEFEAFRRRLCDQARTAAEAAAAFQKAFPEDPRAKEALRLEQQLLETACKYGASDLRPRLEEVTDRLLREGGLPEAERRRLRVAQVQRQAAAALGKGIEAYREALVRGGRELIREFPKSKEGYDLLLTVARQSGADRARALVEELLAFPDMPAATRQDVLRLRGRLGWLGRRLEFRLPLLDGGELDAGSLKGRVTLLWFWSPKSGLSQMQVPALLEAWKQWKDRGLAVVGVCPAADRRALELFLEETDLPWPQTLDDLEAPDSLIRRLAIGRLPALWLLDRRGVVIDQNARERLPEKLDNLLGGTPVRSGTAGQRTEPIRTDRENP